MVLALQRAGAGLLLGTDTPPPLMPYLIPGFSAHRELQALVRAGLTPYEALATGTRNVATYFGTLAESGTVTKGKRADLVLLTDDPLTDIRNTLHIAGVMRGGRWFARQELDERLAAIRNAMH
jgi:imidazolonepropionase-like amidohydrolase